MSRQGKNTFGLIVVVLVILCAFFWLNPMFRYSCSRVFMHDFLGMEHGILAPGAMFFDIGLARMVPLMAMFILWACVALWVYHDAERRGHSGVLWALLVFVGNIIGLIIYLIMRSTSAPSPALAPTASPPVATASCPSCAQPIQSSYVACPHCGVSLVRKCAQCDKRIEPDWKVCPYCGRDLDGREA